MFLNEKQLEIVEQYQVKVTNSYRSRGCLHLDTDQGLFILIPYTGSPLRLACELELLQKLKGEGFDRVDLIWPNKEEGLISYDKYRTPFILKRAYNGKECSLKEEREIEEACRNLGRLHTALSNLEEYNVERRQTPAIPVMLRDRKTELRRIRNYMKKSGKRTPFELAFTSCYKEFYEEAEAAVALADSYDVDFYKRGYGICHGTYHHHNILMMEEGVATLNFGQFHYNQQILDLYHFMRKALEKNQFRVRVFEAAVRGYRKERELLREDFILLKMLFIFPEKFRKISSQFYNTKKCFIPPKNLEKLERIIEQNDRRKQFLKELEEWT